MLGNWVFIFMGQRLIITEEEKNKIRLLYESTPPDESVLVTNKNPFKYPEYESARKPYSSSLKDGDLYYVLNYKADETIEELLKPTYDSFIGKTIRRLRSDEISKIKPITGTEIIYDIPLNKSLMGGLYIYYVLGYGNYPIEGDPVTVHITEKGDIDISGYYRRGEINKDIEPEIYNALYTIGSEMKKKLTEIISNPSQLPDDIFEIRKIQRQKTDF